MASRTTPKPTMTDEPITLIEETAPAQETEEQEEKRLADEAKIAERRAYAKERRERIKAEREAAGLILNREYTTADGATFKTKREAVMHIAVLKFRELIESQPLNSNDGYPVDPEAIADWLKTHKESVLAFLREVKN